MIVIVCGGRDFGHRLSEAGAIHGALSRIHSERPISMVIEGGAEGTDFYAGEWAKLHGVHVATVHALWDKYGLAAGPRRNKAMLELKPDAVIAFPGGKGTASMKALARKAGVEVIEPELPE